MSEIEQDKPNTSETPPAESPPADSSDGSDGIDVELGPPEEEEPRAEAAPDAVRVTASMRPPAWPPKIVADLMTRKVITAEENEPVGDLESWMERFRFHHLLVVGPGMKLVGLITHSDFLHAMLGVGPNGQPLGTKIKADTPASEVMNRNVVTAQPDTPLTTALRVMLHEKLGCLPVILEDKTIVGILTATDFARLSLELLEAYE